jgi:hypothetical protein
MEKFDVVLITVMINYFVSQCGKKNVSSHYIIDSLSIFYFKDI